MKVASYQEPTAPDGSGLALGYLERKGEAVLMFGVIDALLPAPHRAWLDATYEGAGAAREAAVATLCTTLAALSRHPALLPLIIMRNFVWGETFCPSLRDLARETSVPKSTCCDVDQRVLRAMQALARETGALLRPALERRGWLAPRPARLSEAAGH